MNVEIVGLDKFIADTKRAGANVKPLINAALVNSTNRTQKNIRQRASHKTGALQRSVLTQVDYPHGKVSANEKYAEYVEKGTRPHTITPKNKKALFWKGALNPYKSVHHPGTKAKPFFKPGVEASIQYVQEQFTKVMEIVISQMAGK